MQLSALLEGVPLQAPAPDLEMRGVTCDSRRVEPGWLFVAIPGGTADGHRFIQAAVNAGASAVLAERSAVCGVPLLCTADTRAAFQLICANFFGHPERALRFIGVTGTNGKTSTAQFVKSVLDGLGEPAGLIGTVHNQIGAETFPAAFTTPEPYQLFALLAEMQKRGVKTVVMEVSSQAMDQRRVDSLHFCAAGFTNLTQDHLDYHKTMENYRAAKERLFSMADRGVYNLDDETGRAFASRYGGLTYTAENRAASLKADQIRVDVTGAAYRLTYGAEQAMIRVSTPGLFTVHNTLCAAGLLLAAGYPFESVAAGLNRIPQVPGRAEVLTEGLPFTVMRDYAHTPDALENILSTLKSFAAGRIVTLFGCGGDRDRTKRPLMAAAAAKYSDALIVTSDNPRSEEPGAIIREILTGLTDAATPYTVIENRRAAIEHAIRSARPGDLILLAGKGHEDYQILKTGKIHFDEKEIVKEIIESL